MVLHKIILATIDFCTLNGAFLAALWVQYRSGWYYPLADLPLRYLPAFLLFSLIQIAVFQTRGLYKYQVFLDVPTHVVELLKGLGVGFLLFVTASFLFRSPYVTDSRLVVGWTFLLTFLGLLVARCGLARSGYLYLRGKGWRKRVLIVGAGKQGQAVARKIANCKLQIANCELQINHAQGPSPQSAIGNRQSAIGGGVPYFEVVGFVDDDPEKWGQSYEGVPVLGGLERVEELVREHRVQEILIAINLVSQERMLELVEACQGAGVPVHIVSDLYQVITQKVDVEEFGGILTVKLPSERPALVNTVLKRTGDLVGSALLLILLSPLFLVLAALIKLTSKGPVFYSTTVVGKGGRPFTWYKFRSMKANSNPEVHKAYMRQLIADGKKPVEKLRNDDRITPVGRFIRKYSLDELPQLFNVFLGQMSLVGPRPCLPYEWEAYKLWHRRRLSVTPGMTGLWQVTGRAEVSIDDMVVLDLYYIHNRSLAMDLEILLKTIPVVLFGKGGR